jgi:para-nitrobenzyl esterase
VRKIYGSSADEILKAYPAAGNDAVMDTATALASDRFIAYSTWRWIDLCAKTGDKPVYRYYFERPRPPMRPEMGNATAGLAGGVIRGNGAQSRPAAPPRGAVHSAEIEYALGNLSTNRVYAWTPDDYKVSRVMEDYFANFIKRGDPNGDSLPKWPALNAGGPPEVMHINVESRAEPEQHGNRYLVMEKIGH